MTDTQPVTTAIAATPSLWIWTRKPSNLTSCCQSSPSGACRIRLRKSPSPTFLQPT